MNEMQDKLFDSLLEYWQRVIDELVAELRKAYPNSSGLTRQSITAENVMPISSTSTGYRVSLFMPDYYEYLDEGVSGAKRNTGISRFEYTDLMPPVSVIKKWMFSRGITKPRDSGGKKPKPKKSRGLGLKRKGKRSNTKAGKSKDIDAILNGIAFAIAKSIYNKGLQPSRFYSNVINDKELQEFEQQLLDDYGDFILGVVKVD